MRGTMLTKRMTGVRTVAFLLLGLGVGTLFGAEVTNLNLGWEFTLRDFERSYRKVGLCARAGEILNDNGATTVALDRGPWQTVDLPHDWALTLPYVYTNNLNGSKAIGAGFPQNSVGWYRRRLAVPAEADGKRLFLEFDGVFRDAQFWMNGCYLGRNESGYLGCRFEVTDLVRYGKADNQIAVRVDANSHEGWWYEGAGIYRSVRLVTKSADGLVPDSVRILLKELKPDAAVMRVDYETFTDGPAGYAFTVEKPRLWSPDDPYLYRLELKGETFTYGIRTVTFDAARGLLLNGKRVDVRGVCCHQDHAGVGVAIPDALQDYRIRLLKEMGVNAYRASHNPPSPVVLDACDRYGILVLDETRIFCSAGEGADQFRRLILRDRNHPCVIAWSLGNEEHNVQGNDTGRRIVESMKHLQRQLDPTRLSTYSGNNGRQYDGANAASDIRGVNYVRLMREGTSGQMCGGTDDYHAAHPEQPIWGSEEASTLATRGGETFMTNRLLFADSDVEQNRPKCWNLTAEEWTTFYAARPYLAGAFVWTGFDYRGESWVPATSCCYGILDLCGFPKNNASYYAARWTDRDVLHVYPHWNLPRTNLWVNTNCDEVELFVNGRSIGRRRRSPDKYRLAFPVSYEPGTVEARGVRKGRPVSFKMETSGAVCRLRLDAVRTVLTADGQDATVVNVTALDAAGRMVPNACCPVYFEQQGMGRLLGVGNGDPMSHEPDVCHEGQWMRTFFNGRCQVVVGASAVPGDFVLTAWLQPSEKVAVTIRTNQLAGRRGM